MKGGDGLCNSWVQIYRFFVASHSIPFPIITEEDRRKHQASFLFSAYILHRLVKAKYDDIRRVNGGLPLSWPNPLTEHFLKKYTQVRRKLFTYLNIYLLDDGLNIVFDQSAKL